MPRKSFASRLVRLAALIMAALLGWSFLSSVSATTATAAVPPDITYYKAWGTYLRNVDKSHYKIGLYIPKNKKNGTTLGKTELHQWIMGGDVKFTATFTRANSARFNAILTQTIHVKKYLNNSDTKRHIEIWCDMVRIGSDWEAVEPTTGKYYFFNVAGKKTTYRARFYAVLKYYDLDNDVWKIQEEGYFYTPIQTISWVKKK